MEKKGKVDKKKKKNEITFHKTEKRVNKGKMKYPFTKKVEK